MHRTEKIVSSFVPGFCNYSKHKKGHFQFTRKKITK
jgi:hypothetical protein